MHLLQEIVSFVQNVNRQRKVKYAIIIKQNKDLLIAYLAETHGFTAPTVYPCVFFVLGYTFNKPHHLYFYKPLISKLFSV